MKKITLFIAVAISAISLMAQPPKGPAKKGMTFGVKTTAAGAIAANELPTLLDGKETADVKIKGKVVEVCKAEGCWQ